MSDNVLSVSPNPASQGATVRIGYRFGKGQSSERLKIEWTDTEGESTPQTVVVNSPGEEGEGFTCVAVPAGAAGGRVSAASKGIQPVSIGIAAGEAVPSVATDASTDEDA